MDVVGAFGVAVRDFVLLFGDDAFFEIKQNLLKFLLLVTLLYIMLDSLDFKIVNHKLEDQSLGRKSEEKEHLLRFHRVVLEYLDDQLVCRIFAR